MKRPRTTTRSHGAVAVARWALSIAGVALAWIACPVAAEEAGVTRPDSVSLLVIREPGTSACPDESELRQQVEARAGRDLFSAEASSHVIVRVSFRRGVHRASLTILDGEELVGERMVEDRDCGEVVESTAVLLAMLFAPATPTAPPVSEEPSSDVPEDEAATTVAPDPVVAESADAGEAVDAADSSESNEALRAGGGEAAVSEPTHETQTDPLRVSITAAAGVIFGWLPDATLVGRGAIGVGQRSWSVRLEGRAALDTMASGTIDGTPASATVSWAGGAVVGCGHVDVLALCGHVVLARSAGRGVNVELPHADEALVLGLGASAGVGWQPWPWLRLEAEAELDVPVLVPEARVDGIALWRATPVAGMGTVGASIVIE